MAGHALPKVEAIADARTRPTQQKHSTVASRRKQAPSCEEKDSMSTEATITEGGLLERAHRG